MIKESLPEFLNAAKFCLEFRKKDGGCLGYSCALLLFSVIDSIGSYFRGNSQFEINIDYQATKINKDGWEHFKILNSNYFKQNLSENFIRKLYSSYRSFLSHNAVLGRDSLMIIDNTILNDGTFGRPFIEKQSHNMTKCYIISLSELYSICEIAVSEFYKDIDNVVPYSKQGSTFH